MPSSFFFNTFCVVRTIPVLEKCAIHLRNSVRGKGILRSWPPIFMVYYSEFFELMRDVASVVNIVLVSYDMYGICSKSRPCYTPCPETTKLRKRTYRSVTATNAVAVLCVTNVDVDMFTCV